jgi:hypothetical protein
MSSSYDSAADPAEVVAWFNAQPDLAVHVIAFANTLYEDWDCSSIDDVVEEFEFWNVGQLGFVPVDLIENLGEFLAGEEIIWESRTYVTGREWVVYKVWWFVVSIFKDIEGLNESVHLFPVSQLEKAIDEASKEASEDEDEGFDFLYSPEKDFEDIDDVIRVKIDAGTVILERIDPSSLYGRGTRDHFVQLLRLDDGTFIVATTHFDQTSKYRFVESESEGREIIEKFW